MYNYIMWKKETTTIVNIWTLMPEGKERVVQWKKVPNHYVVQALRFRGWVGQGGNATLNEAKKNARRLEHKRKDLEKKDYTFNH